MAALDIKTLVIALTCFVAGMITKSMMGPADGTNPITNESKFKNSTILTRSAHFNQTEDPTPAATPVPTRIEQPPVPQSAMHPTNNLPIMKQIIPPSLHPSYTPENLEFNITEAMLKRSRPIIGNNERLHGYIQKLHSKQCTVVLFLGGSVTDGHNVKGRSAEAYPAHFVRWLNARYPCVKSDGSAGFHVMKKTHAQNSQTHFIHWSMVSEIERIDLVLIEFNVNDSFIKDLPHALEDKGEAGSTRAYADLWYSEVILRRLLLLRKPDPLAIITFNADYVGASWAPPPHSDPVEDRKRLFRRNEEPMKLWISSLYEIPVFSASIWMLPLASKLGMTWQFNKTHNPYSTARWHADRCCHPHREGHRILVVILAYCIVTEEKEMLQSNETILEIERDWTLRGTLRDPVYLSPKEESMYVRNNADAAFSVDFTDPEGQPQWKDKLVSNDGPWEWYADNVDKDKFGLIVNGGANGGQHITIAIVGGQYGIIEVSYVVSYENFGISFAWVDNVQNNTNQPKCNTAINDKVPVNTNLIGPQRLIAVWDEPASVPRIQLLHTALVAGQTGFFHVCLTPKGKHVKGTENKFKLLGVRAY